MSTGLLDPCGSRSGSKNSYKGHTGDKWDNLCIGGDFELMIIFLRVTMALGPWRGASLFLRDTCGSIWKETSSASYSRVLPAFMTKMLTVKLGEEHPNGLNIILLTFLRI